MRIDDTETEGESETQDILIHKMSGAMQNELNVQSRPETRTYEMPFPDTAPKQKENNFFNPLDSAPDTPGEVINMKESSF